MLIVYNDMSNLTIRLDLTDTDAFLLKLRCSHNLNVKFGSY